MRCSEQFPLYSMVGNHNRGLSCRAEGKISRRLIIICALVSMSILPQLSHAQTITVHSHLVFNKMFAGTSQRIDPASSQAASFTYAVLALSFRIDILLPEELIRDGTGESMPISFANGDGLYETKILGLLGGNTPFNPHESLGFNIALLSSVRVNIGGTISPPAHQRPGIYRGTIVLTATVL